MRASRIGLEKVPTSLEEVMHLAPGMETVLELWQPRAGDILTVVDPEGGIYRARFLGPGQGVRPFARLPASIEPRHRRRLAQALPDRERMLWIIQKAVELGVTDIQPVLSAHSSTVSGHGSHSSHNVSAPASHGSHSSHNVSTPAGHGSHSPRNVTAPTSHGSHPLQDKSVSAGHGSHPLQDKSATWPRIIRKAALQCRRAMLPEIFPPIPLAEVPLTMEPGEVLLYMDVSGERQALFTLAPTLATRPLTLLAGPEGGWSDPERDLLQTAGGIAISLGSRLLRTETAGMAALAVLASAEGTFTLEEDL
ncbi:MAG: 16S rRNA (uracil(1498)-N(3))-methyltransferase [Magnetococcus sp. DMHC-1]|nr:16S rRNA (uracil(1498)-N(3))-methyltransferase [Magnetococcales bacterium]